MALFKTENCILATHNKGNVSLVFTKGIGMLKDHYKLTVLVDGAQARKSEVELVPNVYMGKANFDLYSQLMRGSTSELIEMLKSSCSGKGESLYLMAMLLENACSYANGFKL